MSAQRQHNRGGRPRKTDDQRRDHMIAVKVNAAEKEVILKSCKKAGMKPGPFLREVALKGKVTERMSPEYVSAVKDLSYQIRQLGTNINTVAKRANAGLPGDYVSAVKGAIGELQRIVDNINDKLL